MALYQIAAPCGCCYYRATFTTTTTTSCTTQIDSFDEAENKSCRHHHHHRRDQKGGIVFEKRSRLGLLQRRAASPSLFQSVPPNPTRPNQTKPNQRWWWWSCYRFFVIKNPYSHRPHHLKEVMRQASRFTPCTHALTLTINKDQPR